MAADKRYPDPEVNRDKTVVEAPEQTFEERTENARPAWQNEDGSQNTGAEDLGTREPTIEGADAPADDKAPVKKKATAKKAPAKKK